MKTRTLFLATSIVMIVIEAILGVLAFNFSGGWGIKISIFFMMLVGLAVAIIMFIMYRDEKREGIYEKV